MAEPAHEVEEHKGVPNETPANAAAASGDGGETIASLNSEVAWRGGALLNSLALSMRNSDAPDILKALTSESDSLLRQPPLAAQRALAVSRDSHASVADLVRLIESDPGLAQALLRQANSSFYTAGGGPSSSLGEAVQRVGMRGVENVLLAAMVEGLLCRPGGIYDAMVTQVWSHMVRTAPLARRISPAFGVEAEHAFTLGLLHDAGKLVLFDRISTLRNRWRRELRVPPEFLRRSLGLLHESIGGLAAMSWGLGPEAARAIATHHRLHPPKEENPRSEVIFVAEKMDLAELRGQTVDFELLWIEGFLSGTSSRLSKLLTEDEKAA